MVPVHLSDCSVYVLRHPHTPPFSSLILTNPSLFLLNPYKPLPLPSPPSHSEWAMSEVNYVHVVSQTRIYYVVGTVINIC